MTKDAHFGCVVDFGTLVELLFYSHVASRLTVGGSLALKILPVWVQRVEGAKMQPPTPLRRAPQPRKDSTYKDLAAALREKQPEAKTKARGGTRAPLCGARPETQERSRENC